ncbi:MAG: hypothetical protein K5761_06710 [Clostridiales bacterium]|nr:hypothetical protein [Clostridiales bacterium]
MKNKSTAKEKVNISLSYLFSKKWFMLLISFFVAFSVWVYISVVESPIIVKTISDVAVKIDTSVADQQDLQIFGEKEYKIDVTVSGKKYVVNSLKSEDISATANTSYVNSAGSKTLQIKIEPVSNTDDYKIVSSSESYLDVYFDTYKEKELPIRAVVNSSLDSYVPEDCIVGDIVLSQSTVKVSGPSSEINRIEKIEAAATVKEVLEKALTVAPEISVVTSDNSKLEYTNIDTGKTELTMTVPVLKIVNLPASIDFANAPAYFINHPLLYTVNPENIKVAIPVENVESTKSVVIDSIDFADINNGSNYFTVKASDISNYKVQNELQRYSVRVDASSLRSKYISLSTSAIKVENKQTDYTVEINSSKNISIKVIGTEDAVNSITADDIKAVVNTADITLSAGTSPLPVTFSTDKDSCWIYGKYETLVNIADNT